MRSHRRRRKQVQPAKTKAKRLRPENRRLLALLKKLVARPDDKGEAWWDEFRDFLRKNPVKLGKPAQD